MSVRCIECRNFVPEPDFDETGRNCCRRLIAPAEISAVIGPDCVVETKILFGSETQRECELFSAESANTILQRRGAGSSDDA